MFRRKKRVKCEAGKGKGFVAYSKEGRACIELDEGQAIEGRSFKEHSHLKDQRYEALEDSIVRIEGKAIELKKGETFLVEGGKPHCFEKGKVRRLI